MVPLRWIGGVIGSGGVPLGLLVISVTSSVILASRATRIDPLTALRYG